MSLRKVLVVGALTVGLSTSSFAGYVSDRYNDLTNKNNTWGSQDRTGQFYVGLAANGFATADNSKAPNSGWDGLVGYHFTDMFAMQYNQFGSYNGMFGGLGEGVFNLDTGTMITPYAVGGAGYASLSNKVLGAWSVGGGLKFELSKQMDLFADYRYIQTISPTSYTAPMESGHAGSVNMISGGLNFYFGGNDDRLDTNISQNDVAEQTPVIVAPVSVVNVDNYTLPEGIEQCANNFNLTEDDIACYTIHGDDITVHLDTKFAYNDATLNIQGRNAIAKLVSFVKENNIHAVDVRGYASQGRDGEQYAQYNKDLSKRRAQSVKDYMGELGISKDMITTEGFGWEQPLVPNTTKENRNINQRVQASVSAPLKD